MKLHIGKPYISVDNEMKKARLNFLLTYPGGRYELYYEVSNQYKNYLTVELSDAAIVCVLLYAMERNWDIECEGNISERLYNQINKYLIPAISRNISRYSLISIIAKTSNVCFKGKAVGTDLSCGVDSFYTALKSLDYPKSSSLRLTHCCFFNSGSTGFWGGTKARTLYEKRMERFKYVGNELGCEFLACDSNMTEFLLQENEMTHVFRTLSFPLALQKLFSTYYFASTYPFEDFKFTDFDPSYYDILTLTMLSTQNIRFELVGAETSRLGKVRYLADYEITYNNLHVCITDEYNCGHCRKCLRTMLDFYLIGKLNCYSDVFDLKFFNSHLNRIYIWALLNFWRVDMPEIVVALLKQHKVHIIHIIAAIFVSPFYYVKVVAGKIRFKLSIKIKKGK